MNQNAISVCWIFYEVFFCFYFFLFRFHFVFAIFPGKTKKKCLNVNGKSYKIDRNQSNFRFSVFFLFFCFVFLRPPFLQNWYHFQYIFPFFAYSPIRTMKMPYNYLNLLISNQISLSTHTIQEEYQMCSGILMVKNVNSYNGVLHQATAKNKTQNILVTLRSRGEKT